MPTGESGADVTLLLDDIDLIVDGSLADVANILIEASAQGFSLRGEGLDAKGTSPLKLIGPASRLSLQPATLSTFGQEFAIGGSASIVDPVSWQIDAEGLVMASLGQGLGEVVLRLRRDSATEFALAIAHAPRPPTEKGRGGPGGPPVPR